MTDKPKTSLSAVPGDIERWNVSAYNRGTMGYGMRSKEGAMLTN